MLVYKRCGSEAEREEEDGKMPAVPCYSQIMDIVQSHLKAKLFYFLDENRLISVVLSGRFQRLERDFDVLF